jgi:hypothetical protein
MGLEGAIFKFPLCTFHAEPFLAFAIYHSRACHLPLEAYWMRVKKAQESRYNMPREALATKLMSWARRYNRRDGPVNVWWYMCVIWAGQCTRPDICHQCKKWLQQCILKYIPQHVPSSTSILSHKIKILCMLNTWCIFYLFKSCQIFDITEW